MIKQVHCVMGLTHSWPRQIRPSPGIIKQLYKKVPG